MSVLGWSQRNQRERRDSRIENSDRTARSDRLAKRTALSALNLPVIPPDGVVAVMAETRRPVG